MLCSEALNVPILIALYDPMKYDNVLDPHGKSNK